MKLSLPFVACALGLPALFFGAVTFALYSFALRIEAALAVAGVSAGLLSFFGFDWEKAFRSRNPDPTARDERHFALSVFALYLVATAVPWTVLWFVSRKVVTADGSSAQLAFMIAVFLSGWIFWASHQFLSARSPFRRGRALLDFGSAKERAKKYREGPSLMVPLGGLLLPSKSMTTHTAFIGAPESGKSLSVRLMMQAALPLVGLGRGHRALIYAAKREDLPFLAGMNLKAPVHLLHPFDLRSSAWDMSEVNDLASAREISTALIPEEQGQNRYFTDAARELLCGVIWAFILNAPGRWEFRDLLLALRSEARLRELFGKRRETRYLIDLHFEPRGTFQNIRSTLGTRLDLYEPVAASWHRAETKIRLRDWAAGESIVILGNDPMRRAAIHPINRVILKWVSQLLLAKPNTDTERSSIWLDELPDLGKVECLLELLGEGRSKGVAAVIGTQSIDALHAHYGKDLAEAILATISQLGLLRSSGSLTAKWQSDRLGDYEFDEVNETITRRPGERTTVAYARHVANRKSVLPSQFLSLPATNPTNGLGGFYVSSAVGAWWCHLPGNYLSKVLLSPDAAVADFIPRPKDHEVLIPWGENDFRRLGFSPTPPPEPFAITPQGKKPPKLPPNRGVKR